MPQNDDKIRVSARISKDLYDSVLKIDDNFTHALVTALTAFINPNEKNCRTDYDQVKTNDDKIQIDLIKGQLDIMTAQVDFLKRQIDFKDSQLEKQAYSLQSLIQVNSALNMKLLPEKTPVSTEGIEAIVKEPEINTLDSMIQNEESKPVLEKTCLDCGKSFQTINPSQIYCCKKCKDATYNKNRREKRAEKKKEV